MAHEFPADLTDLLAAARDGDRLALSVFVRRTQGDVWRLCRRLGSGAAPADDLTQEVYLRALGALPRFRADASARTWLLAIARHTCADAVRKAKRARSRGTQRADSALDAPRSCEAEADALQRLVDGLDRDRREAFVLTQVIGLRYAEAAEVCGVPVGTIRSRVAPARDDLVASLREAAEG